MNRVAALSSLALVVATSAAAQNFEVRLGGIAMSTKRNIEINPTTIPQTSSTMTGAEFMIRGPGAGLAARFFKGNFDPGIGVAGYREFRLADARLLLGPRPFTVELGYARRALSSKLLDDPAENLATVGVRSLVNLGPAGLSIMTAATALGRIAKDTALRVPTSSVQVGGWTVETGVLYQAPRRIPLFGFLGYRYERFKTRLADAANPGRREEMSGLLIELGFRYVR